MPDHPRIRGEHLPKPPAKTGSVGSSPHTRGAHLILDSFCGSGGIIPAYAGSTGDIRFATLAGKDHPRIRGEHGLCNLGPEAEPGSSPHTRGAQGQIHLNSTGDRIIPAYAGSTDPEWRPGRGRADHPRIRGEHTYANMEQESILGSSPHTRGARLGRRHPPAQDGIIPAYAGSTRRKYHRSRHPADHPRIRGEHCPWRKPKALHFGSSPHTRGAH